MIKPVIKWSGSKRTQASEILKYIPLNYNVYYEPFVGGGSILYALSPKKAICGDICFPLIKLWNEIKNNPIKLSNEYKIRWNRLQKEGHTAYYAIRENFNKTKSPYDLMFLSRTCVNGLIRFNSKGDFNNSLHHTRPGIKPECLEKIILDWSTHLAGATFYAQDYQETVASATKNDFIYLDPPYLHTVGRYYGTSTIDFNIFLKLLDELNRKGVRFILSFDGKRKDKDYTVELPCELYKRHILVNSGYSCFKKVIEKEKQEVLESLYLNY